MSAAVEAFVSLFKIASFVLADKQHFTIIDFCEPGVDGSIIAKRPVPVQFDEFVADQFDIISCLRAVLVPSDLNRLPRIQILEHIAFQLGDFDPHISDRLQCHRSRTLLGFQFGELFFQFDNWTFKRQHVLRLHKSGLYPHISNLRRSTRIKPSQICSGECSPNTL